MKNALTTGLAALLMVAVGFLAEGCVASIGEDPEDTPPGGASWQEEEDSDSSASGGEEQIGVAEQAFTTWRSDFSATITPATGSWGTWKQDIYCNPGSWVAGYRMRVEPHQGSGYTNGDDDTALNSVQLLCRTPSGSDVEWISSYDGLWGAWGSSASCSGAGNLVTSARMRVEGSQGNGDDTAANNVTLGCSGGGSIQASGGMGWGSWGDWAFCPVGTAACGLSIRFEGSQGGGDDTAMNGMRLHCCTTSSSGSPDAEVPTTGLKLWLRADQGVVSSGAQVSSWQDQSGNANHATMATASRQPSLITGALNGKPVLRFYGDDSLLLSAPVQPTSFTIFVVGKNNKATESYSMILGPGGSWPNNQLRWENGSQALFVGTGNNLPVTVSNIGNTRLYHLLSAGYNGSSMEVHRDGNFVSSHSFVTSGPWTLAQVGAWYSSYFMQGDLAEIMVYDQALSSTDRISVESYLEGKYGLP